MPSFIPFPRLSRLSVRARLGLIQLLLLLALSVIGLLAWHALTQERRIAEVLATISRAERYHFDGDMMHDALRADVNAALRLKAADSAAAGEVLAHTREDADRFEADLAELQRSQVPAGLARDLALSRAQSRADIALAIRLVTTAASEPEQALKLAIPLDADFDSLSQLNDRITESLAHRVAAAETEVFRDEDMAKIWIIAAGIATALLAWSFVALIASSIRRSLHQISEAARALAAGNLSVRSEIASEDEVGELARAVNKMADDLQRMIDRLLAEADRDAFSAQLTQALDMAEAESDIRAVISRAMPEIGDDIPMELLLSDANRSSLLRAAEHPSAGAPACAAESLSSCVAIRRGSAIVFQDSETLDACPRLRNRPSGPLSAVCVPVTFMGRSFGVLHAGGSVRKPPSPQQIAQINTLATQGGARIGNLRAFARTQLQALTDGLTGLSNRRALQASIQEITDRGSRYAFALADLDQFKRLNDMHGHEAGDKALCLFAEVLRASIRDGDHAGRWGGEEFAIVFPGAAAEQALEVVERIRAHLAEALLTSHGMPFTASFGISDSTLAASFDEQLRIADDALYRSKDAGRDRATIGHPAPARSSLGREPSQDATAEDEDRVVETRRR
jgi:diguanylate cyclase (GGDEF)-like protein